MKQYLIITVLLAWLLVSCKTDNIRRNDATLAEDVENHDEIETNKKKHPLHGTWDVYARKTGKNVRKCNVCPKIEFSEWKTATLSFPGGSKELYYWSVQNNVLELTSAGGDGTIHYFKTGKYSFHFDEKEELTELILSMENAVKIILTK